MEFRGTLNGTACMNYQGWLYILDISDPTAPIALSQTRMRDSKPADMHGLYYSNGYLYAGIQAPATGVSIYDVSNPAAPLEVRFLPTPTGTHNLRVADHRLYVMPNGPTTNQILVYDVTDPRNPVQRGVLSLGAGGFCHDVSVMENVGYASCWSNDGLVLLDLTDPASIAVTGRYTTPETGSLHSAWPTPDRRHVLSCQEDYDFGVRVFDVSTGAPTPIDQYNLGTGTVVHDVMIVGRYAYVTYYQDGVRVLDLADPANVVEVGRYLTAQVCSAPPWCGSISEWLEDGILYVVDMATGFHVFTFDLPHEAPITMYAVKARNLTDVALTWNHTGESQYTLRDGLAKQVPGPARTDVDGRLSHVEAGVIPDGRLHYYKLNGPWR